MTAPVLPGLPEPPEVWYDLRNLPLVSLDPAMLRGAAFAPLGDAAFRAQVLLVCASWREAQAGSLPDCQASLFAHAGLSARLEGAGAVLDEALAHWTLCSDARWWLWPALEALERVGAGLRDRRDGAGERQRNRRLRDLMRRAGVDPAAVPDAVLTARIADIDAALRHEEEMAGGALKGAAREAAGRRIADRLGLIGVHHLAAHPRRGGGFAPLRPAMQTIGVAEKSSDA